MIDARELKLGDFVFVDGEISGEVKELRETHARILYQGEVNGKINNRLSLISYERLYYNANS